MRRDTRKDKPVNRAIRAAVREHLDECRENRPYFRACLVGALYTLAMTAKRPAASIVVAPHRDCRTAGYMVVAGSELENDLRRAITDYYEAAQRSAARGL
jgi:hypothetical protein